MISLCTYVMLSGFGCALVPEIEEAAAAVACFGIIIRLEVQLSRLYSSVLPGTDEATPAVAIPVFEVHTFLQSSRIDGTTVKVVVVVEAVAGAGVVCSVYIYRISSTWYTIQLLV